MAFATELHTRRPSHIVIRRDVSKVRMTSPESASQAPATGDLLLSSELPLAGTESPSVRARKCRVIRWNQCARWPHVSSASTLRSSNTVQNRVTSSLSASAQETAAIEWTFEGNTRMLRVPSIFSARRLKLNCAASMRRPMESRGNMLSAEAGKGSYDINHIHPAVIASIFRD